MVEDNELLRHAVATMLRRDGLFVFEAKDGSSAVELFEAHEAEIGLVLLDMSLPGMSGEQVFEQLEKIRPGVRVVITTAHSKDTIETVMCGRKPWIALLKPYRVSDLLALIRISHTGEISD